MEINGQARIGATVPEGGLPAQWTQQEILSSLLRAVRATFVRNLNIKTIPVIASNSQAAKWSENKTVGYPKAYLKFHTWEYLKELSNFSIARRGFVARQRHADQTTVYNARVFPYNLGGELRVLVEGYHQATNMIGEIGMLDASRSLGLSVKLANAFEYKTIIQIESTISLDDADFSSEDKKAVYDLNFPFRVRGWFGRIDRTVMNLESNVLVEPVVGRTLQSHIEEMLENPELYAIGEANVSAIKPPYRSN